jgi:hypothetical protein
MLLQVTAQNHDEQNFCFALYIYGFILRLSINRPTSKSHNASGNGTHAQVQQSTQGLLGWTTVPPSFSQIQNEGICREPKAQDKR